MSDRAGLKTARVFIALWPDDAATRAELAALGARLHEAVSGRSTRSETIHLTLVFIGDLARERIPDLVGKLATVAAPSFRIEFDRIDCWRHNRIAYLAPTRAPDELFDLVAKLEANLEQLAIPFDRRPYKPHVTLVRKAECAKANPASGRVSHAPVWGDSIPIMWSAKRFLLVESVTTPEGVRYDELGSFGLL